MTTARKYVCVEIVEGRALKVCLGERGDDRKGVYAYRLPITNTKESRSSFLEIEGFVSPKPSLQARPSPYKHMPQTVPHPFRSPFNTHPSALQPTWAGTGTSF